MNTEVLSKLRAAQEALSHNRKAMMAIQNPFEGLSDEDLHAWQQVVCSMAASAQAECNAVSEEIARRQPPG